MSDGQPSSLLLLPPQVSFSSSSSTHSMNMNSSQRADSIISMEGTTATGTTLQDDATSQLPNSNLWSNRNEEEIQTRLIRKFGRTVSSSVPIIPDPKVSKEDEKKAKKEAHSEEAFMKCKLCPLNRIGIGTNDHILDLSLMNTLKTPEALTFRYSILNARTRDDVYGILTSNKSYLSNISLPDVVPNTFFDISKPSDSSNNNNINSNNIDHKPNKIGIEEYASISIDTSVEGSQKIQSKRSIPLIALYDNLERDMCKIKSSFPNASRLQNTQLTPAEKRACRWTYRLASWSLVGSIAYYIVEKLFSSPCMMIVLNKARLTMSNQSDILIKPILNQGSPNGQSQSQHQIKIDVKSNFAFDIVLLTNERIEMIPLTASTDYSIMVSQSSHDPELLQQYIKIECPDVLNIPYALRVTDSTDATVDGLYLHDGFKDGASFYTKTNEKDIGIMRTMNNDSFSWSFRKLRPLTSKRGHSTKYRGEKVLFRWEPTKTILAERENSIVPPKTGWIYTAGLSLSTSSSKESKLHIEYLKDKVEYKKLTDGNHLMASDTDSPSSQPKQSQAATSANRPSARFSLGRNRSKGKKNSDTGADEELGNRPSPPSPATSQSPAPPLSRQLFSIDISSEPDSDLGLPIPPPDLTKLARQAMGSGKNILPSDSRRSMSRSPQVSPRSQHSESHPIMNQLTKGDHLEELSEIFNSAQSGITHPISPNSMVSNSRTPVSFDADDQLEQISVDHTKPLLPHAWNKCGDIRLPIPPRSTCDAEDEDEDSARSWMQLHRWLSRAIHLRNDEFDKVSAVDSVGEGLDCRYDIRLMGCPADTMKRQLPFEVCAHAIILSPARLSYLHSIGVTSVYVSARLVCNGRTFPCVPQETPKINLQEVLMMGTNSEGSFSSNSKKNTLANRFLRFKRRESDDAKKNNPNAKETTNITSPAESTSPNAQIGRKKLRAPVSGGLTEMAVPSSSTTPSPVGNDNNNNNNSNNIGNDNETIDDASNTDDGVDDRSELEAEAASITEGESSGVLLWGSKGWLAWSESITALGRLPPSTRIVFTLYGVVSNTWHNGPTKFAVGSIQAFDPLYCARSGNASIRMWPLRDIGQPPNKQYRSSNIPFSLQLAAEELSSSSPSTPSGSSSQTGLDSYVPPQSPSPTPYMDDFDRKSESLVSLLSSRAHRQPRPIRELKNIAKVCENGKEWIDQPRSDEEHIKLLVRFPKYSRPILAVGSFFNPKDISTTTYSTVERHANFHASCADVSFISEKAINIAINEGLTMDQLNRDEGGFASPDQIRLKENNFREEIVSGFTTPSLKDSYSEESLGAEEGSVHKKPTTSSATASAAQLQKKKKKRKLKSKTISHNSELLLPQEKFVAERESRRHFAYIHIQRSIWEKEWNKLSMRPSTTKDNFHCEVSRSTMSIKDRVAMSKASSDFRCPAALSTRETIEYVARGLDDASEALNTFLMSEATSVSSISSDNINVVGLLGHASGDDDSSVVSSQLKNDSSSSLDSTDMLPQRSFTGSSLPPLPPLAPLSGYSHSSSTSSYSSTQTVSRHFIIEKLNAILTKPEDQRSLADCATIWECRYYVISRDDAKLAILSSALMLANISSSTTSYATLLGGTTLSSIGPSNSMTASISTPLNSMPSPQSQGPLCLDPRKRIELRKLFEIWSTLDMKTTLSILENRFLDDIEIRSYAVSSLGVQSDLDLYNVMDKLLECLKLEQFHDSFLARVLIWRCLCPGSSEFLGPIVIKLLHERITHDDGYSSRYLFLLDALLVICPIDRVVKWFKLLDNNGLELEELIKQASGAPASIKVGVKTASSGLKRRSTDLENLKLGGEQGSQIIMTPSKSLASLFSSPDNAFPSNEDVLAPAKRSLSDTAIESVSTFSVPKSSSSPLAALLNFGEKVGELKKLSTNGRWQTRRFATKSNEKALYYWPVQKNGDYQMSNARKIEIEGEVEIVLIDNLQISIRSKNRNSQDDYSTRSKRRDSDFVSRSLSSSSTDSVSSEAGKVKKLRDSFQYDLKADKASIALEWYEHLKKLFNL